jgi:hypothetical protein
MSTHYKNGHHFLAVLDDFSEKGMYIWRKMENFKNKS